MTEPRFMELVRQDLTQRELTGAARAGIAASNVLTRAVFAFQQEKRVADAVELPFATGAAPEAPTELALARWYENHKSLYSTPEYRRVKAVILAPETVVRDLQVSEDELKAAYAARAGSSSSRRSAACRCSSCRRGEGEGGAGEMGRRRRPREPDRGGGAAGRARRCHRGGDPGAGAGGRGLRRQPGGRCRRRCTARWAGTC